MYYEYTLYPLAVAALIFAIWAQVKVNSTFNKYSQTPTLCGKSAAEVARMILDNNGLYNVRIERVGGNLTDHYDPRTEVLRLSDAVYESSSSAAVGVAAHEAGHAVQHAVGYVPIKIRMAIIPICNLGSNLAMPLVLMGLLFSYYPLCYIGIIAFATATVFQLVTLPVEFNASSRALAILKNANMPEEDIYASKKVLTAAALTYVAALATSLANLLRLIVMVNGRKRD